MLRIEAISERLNRAVKATPKPLRLGLATLALVGGAGLLQGCGNATLSQDQLSAIGRAAGEAAAKAITPGPSAEQIAAAVKAVIPVTATAVWTETPKAEASVTRTITPTVTVTGTETPKPSATATVTVTSTVTGTETPKPSATANVKNAEADKVFDATSTGSMPKFVSDLSHGAWSIRGTERLKDNPTIGEWLKRLKDADPKNWPTFPNVPNPKDRSFRVVNGSEVPDGMEYGVPNVPFFQQDRRGDFVVPARHYRLITADYGFQGESCINADAKKRRGCMLLLINQGDKTQIWRNQMADNGFTVPGRYWNGDTLEVGVRGLVSHAANNMLNGRTFANPLRSEVLNAGNGTNAGANCGKPEACPEVDVRVVVHTGDAIVAQARTIVTKDGASAPKS